MSDSSTDIQQEVFAAYNRLAVENYCIIASSALLYADWALCFTAEVERIWRRRFSGATVVYLLNRYVALAERLTLVTSVLLVTESDKVCAHVLRTDDGLTDLGNLAIAAFMILRVLGIWGRDWRPVLVMLALVLVPPMIPIYIQTQYTPIAFGAPLYGCGAAFNISGGLLSGLDTGVNAALSAAEILLLALTWIKTYGIRKAAHSMNIRTPLVTLLLRDGTLYFSVLLMIQIFAIISLAVGSTFILFDVWTYFRQAFVVIFTSHFMLNLRGMSMLSYEDDCRTTSLNRSGVIESIVGNLGAPLETEDDIRWSTSQDSGETEDALELLNMS
ncbi:hypothetical protein OBBRIDRAFT_796932 [Obba rivulosa]|uniref:DUF6533 domain-containing protein n=1 Tax=Obba rivulosa TaxID=1052685 RepID=A0A8E2DLC0_9APHY|nr:hypothetical protein OBBRIDRAFT_796932 [Obba rivulosa]